MDPALTIWSSEDIYAFDAGDKIMRRDFCLTQRTGCATIPSLTVERVKRGYKPSKYGRCSFFRPCIDMCYILSLSKTFVFLMRVRMEVLVMIS